MTLGNSLLVGRGPSWVPEAVESWMYVNILLDTILATDVNKYSLAFARCQQRWRTHLANWTYF